MPPKLASSKLLEIWTFWDTEISTPSSPLRRIVLFVMVAPMLASKIMPLPPLSSTRLPSMSAPALRLKSYQMPSRRL